MEVNVSHLRFTSSHNVFQVIEASLEPTLRGAFDKDPDNPVPFANIMRIRKTFNIPNQSGHYELEAPIVIHKFLADRLPNIENPSTPHESILPGIGDWKVYCESTGRKYYELQPVKSLPTVLSKRGSHHDVSVQPIPATEDADFHRPNDIVWFCGRIVCEIDLTSSQWRGWTVSWIPEVVVRVAKLYVRLNHPLTSI
jgi:hypothetical protein